MDRNLKSPNPLGYSAWQEHHVFAVFVFYQTAGARSGEYICERGERQRERERGRERQSETEIKRESRLDGSKLNSCQHLSSVNVLSRVCQSAFSRISVPTLELCVCVCE